MEPAALRIKNVTINGFEIAAFEPPGSSAIHPEMTIDYIAVEPGDYSMANGDLFEAGSINTQRMQLGLGGSTGWDRINFTSSFSAAPAVLLQIQGIENEPAADPNTVSIPWLVSAARNLTSGGIDVALERAEVNAGTVSVDEELAYFAVNNLANGSLVDTLSNNIDYEMFITANNILGWDNGCYINNFADGYSNPLAIATQNTRAGANGGWFRRCSLSSNSIGLQVDEDQTNDSERAHINEQGSVFVFSSAFEANLSQLSHFTIFHDGAGINCLREGINLTAADGAGLPVTSYTGTVILSTSSGEGDWFVLDSSATSSDLANGVLDNGVADDGVATYTFDTTDSGTVTLYLENTHRSTFSISAVDGSITDDGLSGSLTFRPFGFLLTPSPLATQIAGRPFNANLTAAGQTASQPNCGVIEEYTGAQSIHFWSSYISPATGVTLLLIDGNPVATSEAAALPQVVNFSNGVASLSLQYDDAGSVMFFAKDDLGIGEPPAGPGDEIMGGMSPFIVRPFGLDLKIAGDPIATGVNDTVFLVAGNNFNQTLRSVTWQALDDQIINLSGSPGSDGLPDSGADLSDNSVTPNIANIAGSIALTPYAQIITVSNGALLTNTIAFSSFGPPGSGTDGTLTNTQSWSEAGIFTLNANHNDFMGSGQSVIGERQNIGRFIPNEFELTLTDDLSPQCAAIFSYAGFDNGTAGLRRDGQNDLLVVQVRALNSLGDVTVNYQDGLAKLESGTLASSPFNVTTGSPASGNWSVAISPYNFTAGVSTISMNNGFYQYALIEAPFDLRVDVSGTDSDGVTGAQNTSIIPVRLGRAQLKTTYGSELQTLEMPWKSEYFDGTQWRTNTLDNCSDYLNTELQFVAGSYQGDLDPGDTSVILPSPIPETLIAGKTDMSNGFWLTSPGFGNSGEVNVFFDLNAKDWLRFDWDNDGVKDNPQASAGFGLFRGSDRVIYWQEK